MTTSSQHPARPQISTTSVDVTDEFKQVALLAIPPLGLPQSVKALTWIEDITDS